MNLSSLIKIIFTLINKFGTLFLFAFILIKLNIFKKLTFKDKLIFKDKIILSIIFGLFGIMGTYFSFEYKGALINTRIIGVATGGLLGGPLVGLLSGIIAGIHRILINEGTVTALICGVSTIFEGLMAGFMGIYMKNKAKKWTYAILTGIIAESMRKIALLIMIKPFSQAVSLVMDIWIPMIIINSFGLGLLFLILENDFKGNESVAANQADLSFKIADKALPYIRKGINNEEFGMVAKIIYDMTDFDAVTITDREKIIVHIGYGTVRHSIGAPIVTYLTDEVLNTGVCKILGKCEEKDCEFLNTCALKSTLTLPLKNGESIDTIVGTLKLYKNRENAITEIDVKLGQGISQLISTELRISKLEHRSNLLREAEIKALQAQINPHFLFNSLTVIGSLCRTKPDQARDLIYSLSNFFRKNLNTNKSLVSIHEEIEHVKSYVQIEMARLDGELEIHYDVEENIDFQIPPLTLQPIIENSIKHGIYPKRGNGIIKLNILDIDGEYIILVQDNGVGMSKETLDNIYSKNNSNVDSLGFKNVINRLKLFYGSKFEWEIYSDLEIGTKIKFIIPKA